MTNSSSHKKTALILLAAGSSTRMGGKKKEFLPLKNGTVLSECARAFIKTNACNIIALTVPKSAEKQAKIALEKDPFVKNALVNIPLIFVTGGATRQESVKNALEALFAADSKNLPDAVLVHDGARPFVTEKVITETLLAAIKYGAAVPGVTPTDTQKIITEDGFIKQHLQRSAMTAVQTPQGFWFKEFLAAHKKASSDGAEYTDDTEIWEKYVGKVKVVLGSEQNIKITFAEDYQKNQENPMNEIRTGLGYDIHALVPGRKLLIGGVEFDFEKGEAGHSDGDALLHAITDALLGAAALGDIGSFFPPEESKWKDADSSELLKKAWSEVQKLGWRIQNIDCVIKLEKPKFLARRNEVIQKIAQTLQTEPERIFVKAKTGEKMGDVGSGNAIEAWCTCLLCR